MQKVAHTEKRSCGDRSGGATRQGTREERGGLPAGESIVLAESSFQPRKSNFDIYLPRTLREQISLVLSHQIYGGVVPHP